MAIFNSHVNVYQRVIVKQWIHKSAPVACCFVLDVLDGPNFETPSVPSIGSLHVSHRLAGPASLQFTFGKPHNVLSTDISLQYFAGKPCFLMFFGLSHIYTEDILMILAPSDLKSTRDEWPKVHGITLVIE